MAVMGFAVLGLIILQAYWIKSSLKVKEQQFNQLVNNALANLALDIERQETWSEIMSEINPLYLKSQQNNSLYDEYTYDTLITDDGSWLELQHNLHIYGDSDQSFEANISVYNNDSLILKKNYKKPDSLTQKKGSNSQNHLNTELNRRLNQRRLLIDNIVDKMVKFDPHIENRIDPEKLQASIKSLLLERGIKLPFEYAVTKWNNVPVFRSPNFNTDDEKEYYRVRLFPDDFYSEKNYLYIYFPSKENSVFRSLGLMATSSILLTVILLLSFTVTIYIIFRQKRLSEIRNDFVNNMTHELKTPISTISLASQMLGDKSIPNESKNIDYLTCIITDESKKLGHHVEKVLQLAIFEKGKLELKLKKIDIHDLITSIINNFAIQIKHKNGLIIPSLHAERHELIADQVHISNVLTNLIDNAIKYCERDPEIYIETQNENNFLVIAVKDNGIGISKNDIKKIFEKFYRVSTGNIHDVKGFGLGLSYVKKIVEEHKGFIKVDSEIYEGTTFKIYLPLIKN